MTPLMQKSLQYIEQHGPSLAIEVSKGLNKPVLPVTVSLKRLVRINKLEVQATHALRNPIFIFSLKKATPVISDEIIDGVRVRKYAPKFAQGYGI